MDDVRGRHVDGGPHARGCDVPVVAPDHALGRVVPQRRYVGFDRSVLWARDRKVDILHHHRRRSEPWDLDLSTIVRGRWYRESYFFLWFKYVLPDLFASQIESFIPMWEWDIPKKKSKKKKGKAPAGANPEEQLANNGGAFIEEVNDESPEISRPGSRSARVEEVPDEDS